MAKVICTELQKDGASGPNITLDTSKNVTCENNLTVDGTSTLSGNVAVTGNVTVTGTLPADKLTGALPAISGASLTGITSSDTLNNRNLLINGAMRIRQRADVTNAGNEYGGPDRWRFAKNDGAFNIGQTDTVPAGQGFKSSYKVDCTTASSTAGNQYVKLEQRIEGLDLQRLKYGSANAESLTLSFWIRSTKTGTYIATLRNEDQNKHCSKSYTVSASNTWEKKTITFPGDTAAGFDNDNGESLRVGLWIYAGSDYTSGTLATSWATVTAANEGVGQVNAGDNASNDIYFTGIQLEPGSTATDFEHRSYGDELARCQRYYTLISKSAGGQDGAGGNQIGWGYCESSSTFIGGLTLPVTMRAQPSLDYVSGSSYYRFKHGSTNQNVTSLVVSGNNNFSFGFAATGQSGGTAGAAGRWTINNSSGYLAASAEL